VFERHEFLTQVEGYHGITKASWMDPLFFGPNSYALTSIRFHTNLKVYGPYGGTKSGKHLVKFKSIVGRILGFVGCCGGVIDKLGNIIVLADNYWNMMDKTFKHIEISN
jgi:hypothetical protein